MAVAPDFRARAGLADEGVVLRHAAIQPQAHQLALQLVQLLGHRPLAAFALADKDVTLVIEGQARAVVVLAVELGLLAVEHGDIAEAGVAEGGVGGGGAGQPVAVRLRIAEVDPPALGEIWREYDVQQAALAARVHHRHPGQRRRYAAVGVHPAQGAAALGDQETAFGQGRHRPGV